MHRIKRSARRQAWYSEPDYNPFGRLQRPRRDAGIEHELAHVRTENDALSPLELRRRQTESAIQEPSIHAPTRSYTAPSAPSRPHPGTVSGKAQAEEAVVEESAHRSEDHDIELDQAISAARARRKFPFSVLSSLTSHGLELISGSKLSSGSHYLGFASMIKALFGKDTLFQPRWNIFFVFVPVGFALYYTHQNPTAVFIINFVAMLPCTQLLSFGIEQATHYLGERLGDLLSTSSSNVAQLITSIFLLKTRQIAILEASLLGAILQNLLLMTGLSFAIGGITYQEQYFGKEVAQTICMLLLLAVFSLLVPTLAQLLGSSSASSVLMMSRGTAIIIMISYALYMIFQVYTDPEFFETSQPHPGKLRIRVAKKRGVNPINRLAYLGAANAAIIGGAINQENLVAEDEDERETPVLTLLVAVLTVAIGTTLLTFHTSFVTDSLQLLVASQRVSTTFLGLVVLPLLGNDLNAIKTATNDRMDMSLALSLERCMQTALMVVPLIILIAWGMGLEEVSMEFNRFSVAALFASIIIVCYVVQEGKCNWLYGALLVKVFVIIGLASFFTN